LYEQGSQLRRAADSVISNLVEGYGRRRYKAEYIRFLTFSHASNLEVQCHLEKLSMLYPEMALEADVLLSKYDQLGKKLHGFIKHVEQNWNT
jgi:four helix bundle protein